MLYFGPAENLDHAIQEKNNFCYRSCPSCSPWKKESIPDKVQAYFAQLEQYDFTLVHFSGSKHINVNALLLHLITKNITEEAAHDICNSSSLPSVDHAVWSEEQGKDKI